MNPDIWIAVYACLFVVAMFGLSLLVPRRTRTAPSTDGRLDVLSRRVDEVEGVAREALHDVRGVRMVVVGLATKESVNRVEVQLAEMRGEMKGMVANTATTTRAVGRIEDFLYTASTSAAVPSAAQIRKAEEGA